MKCDNLNLRACLHVLASLRGSMIEGYAAGLRSLYELSLWLSDTFEGGSLPRLRSILLYYVRIHDNVYID